MPTIRPNLATLAALAALASLAAAAPALAADPLAESAAYRGVVHAQRSFDGTLVCANGGFASVEVAGADGAGVVALAIHSVLCLEAAGAYDATRGADGAWRFRPLDADPTTRGEGVIGPLGERVRFAFERVAVDADGHSIVETATGVLVRVA